MISDLAIADIESLKADGLQPTAEDIIRLNALGLKIELAQNSAEIYNLPRVAFLGKESFREPTLKHGIWINQILQYVSDDYTTYIAVNAYALSQHENNLLDYTNKNKIIKSISDYCDTNLQHFTFAQIETAIKYVLYGADAIAQEYPPAKKHDDNDYINNTPSAIGCGILIENMALGLGISLSDLLSMTKSQIKQLERLAMQVKGFDTKYYTLY